MSRDEIMSRAQSMQSQASQPEYDARDLSTKQLIKGGFNRGIEGLKGTAFDLIPALAGSIVGNKNYAKEQLKEYSDRMAAEEEINPTAYKSYKDVQGIGDVLPFVGETFGELGPDIAGLITGAGAGAVAGKYAAKKGIQGVLADRAAEYAAKRGLTGEAATAAGEQLAARAAEKEIQKRAISEGARIGSQTGLVGGSMATNVPDVFQSIYEATGNLEPGLALVAGPLVAMLDTYLPGKILSQLGPAGKAALAEELLKKSNVVPTTWKKAFGAELLKTAAGEGGTESLQEAITIAAEQIAGDKKQFFSPENVDRMITSALKGAIGGTTYGLPGAALQARSERDLRNQQIAANQAKALQDQQAGLGTEQLGPRAPIPQRQTNMFETAGEATPYNARPPQGLTPREQDIAAQQQAEAMRQDPTAASERFYQQQQAAQPSAGQQGLDLQGGMTPEQMQVEQRDRQNQEMNQLYMDEVAQKQQEAQARAQTAKQILDDEIALADERVRLGDLNRREAARLDLLHPVLENPSIENTAAAFQANLKRAGYANVELTDTEKALIQKADDMKAALLAAEQQPKAEEVLSEPETEYAAPNKLTPKVTGIPLKQEKGPAGEPKPKEAEQKYLKGIGRPQVGEEAQTEEAAPEPEYKTVLDASLLDSTGLSKQSGFYRQLYNKDMANPQDQIAIGQTLAGIRTNPNLSPNTKQAVESIAMQAFNALAEQQKMFGPRGAVLKGAENGGVRTGPVNQAGGKSVPLLEKPRTVKATERTAPPKPRGVAPTKGPVGGPGVRKETKRGALVESKPKTKATKPPVPTAPTKKAAAPTATRNTEKQLSLRKRLNDLSERLTNETDRDERQYIKDEMEMVRLEMEFGPDVEVLGDDSRTIDIEATEISEEDIKLLTDQTSKLSAKETATLEKHYGVKNGTDEFFKRVREDVITYTNKGAEAVAKVIRDIIKKLQAGVLAVAVVFNPAYMSEQSAVAFSTVTTQVQAEVPSSASDMSDSGKKSYSALYPALQKELQTNNKYFTVVDKPTSKMFVFNPDGSLMTKSNVVLGKALGDMYVGKTDFTKNRITPAGLFKPKAEKGSNTYDGKTVYTLGNVNEGWNAVFMHTVYLKESDAEARKKALATGENTRLSHGCVNGPAELMQKIDNESMDGSHVFIVPDNQSMVDDYIANNVSNEDLTRETVAPATKTTTTPEKPSKPGMAAREEKAIEQKTTLAESGKKSEGEGRFRAGQENEGMDRAEVEAQAKEAVKGWRNAPPVKTVQSESELPQHLQDQIKEEKVLFPKGVWDPRTESVFLIGDNLAGNHDIAYVILHEIVGHFGLQKLLGSKFDSVMNNIYNGNADVKGRADIKIGNGMQKQVAIEEVLAEMAETATNPSLLQKIVNIIRQVLKGFGVEFGKFTNGEIMQLLQDSRKLVTGSAGAANNMFDSQARFSQIGTYADLAKFTPKRIKTILRTYAYDNRDGEENMTKAYVGYVSPEDFLKATTESPEKLKELETDGRTKPLNTEELAGEIQDIFLQLDEDFNLIGHEGRHRMIAFRNAGVKQVPVVFTFYRGEERFERQDQRIPPQRFSGDLVVPPVTGQKGFYADLVPLNYANKDRIIERFGQTEGVPNQARFSAKSITEALKKWFDGSVVVDEDGEPLTLYHGTRGVDYDQFKLSKEGALGTGIYLTPDTEFANTYTGNEYEDTEGGRVIPVIAYITNPLIIRTTDQRFDPAVNLLVALGVSKEKAEKIVEKAQEDKGGITKEVMVRAKNQGYDGIFQYKNGKLSEVVVWSPNQVKSIFNKNPRNDARFSTGAGATFRNNPAAPGVNGNDAKSVFDSFVDKIEDAGILNTARADALHEFLKNGLVGNARKAALSVLPVKALTMEAERAGLKMAPQINTIIDQHSGYVDKLNRSIEPLVRKAEDWAKTALKAQIDLFNKVVYDSTTLRIDPTKAKKEETTQAEYDKVKNDYNKLTPQAKQLYVDMRNGYGAMYQEILDSIEDRINTFVTDPATKAKIKQDILDKLAKRGQIDPYFALTRKGKYWLSYNLSTTKNGETTLEPYVEAYETQRERNKQIALLRQEGASQIQEFSQLSDYKYTNAPSGSFVNKILNILEVNRPKEPVNPTTVEKVKYDKELKAYNDNAEEVMNLYLSTLPETSFAQSFQKRKDTLGFRRDAIEALRDRMYNTAQQLGRMRYSAKLNKLIDDMKEYTKAVSKGVGDKDEEGNPLDAKDNRLLNEYISMFEKHVNFIVNPKVSKISSMLNTIGFNYLLGFNISSAAVNLAQVPMIVAPYLAGEHGWGETMNAINDAYKVYLNSGYGKDARTVDMIGSTERVSMKAMPSIDNYGADTAAGKKYATAIRVWTDNGQLNRSQFYDVLEVDGRKNWSSTLNAATGFAFHHGERMNRHVSLVAAYNLQMKKLAGKIKSEELTQEQAEIKAAEYALSVTEMTNGGVSAAGAPLIAKNNIGKVLFMFKRYGVSMYYMLFKITRDALQNQDEDVRKAAMRQIAGVYGTAALFSGLQGIPMFGVAAMVYNLFADDDEDDMETATRKYVGEFAYKGMLNYVTGAEVASRFSMSDLIFRSNPSASSHTFEQGLLENLGGPVYGVASRIKRGLDMMNEGNMQRGVENVLPSAISNILKSYRYGTDGAKSLRGDPIVEDINAFSLAAQALGFAPAEYVRQLEINSQLKGVEKNILQKKSKLLQQYNISKRMGDNEEAAEHKQELLELNKKHPKLEITADTFERSERAFKAATKRTVNGVQFSQKLYDEMMKNAAEYDR
jgi:hypothetical protein